MLSITFATAIISLSSSVADGSPFHHAPSAAFAFALSTRNKYSSQLTAPSSSNSMLHMVLPSATKGATTVAEIEAESEILRKEIQELREEALRRLEDLDEKLTGSSSSTSSSSSAAAAVSSKEERPSTTLTNANPGTDEELLPAVAPMVITPSRASTDTKKKQPRKTIANLLDGTRWKVSLSIGREPGTWMPDEWGKSGQRINISFIAEFTSSQLFDRDDFLRGGYANSKIMHVIDNEIKLGPSLSEGERTYKVKDGGWQVSVGDGPMGTDLLRFFFEVDEEIKHTGGDVYVPKGRVYSSCGYFPFMGNGDGVNSSSVKEAFTKELDRMETEFEELQKKKEKIMNPFNMEGIKLVRQMWTLNQGMKEVNDKLNFAKVKEPDSNLLRFSNDGDVGLTKEGGVCCQVNKGVVMEYHILGRFSIVSANHD